MTGLGVDGGCMNGVWSFYQIIYSLVYSNTDLLNPTQVEDTYCIF